jgi:hypothetical protein
MYTTVPSSIRSTSVRPLGVARPLRRFSIARLTVSRTAGSITSTIPPRSDFRSQTPSAPLARAIQASSGGSLTTGGCGRTGADEAGATFSENSRASTQLIPAPTPAATKISVQSISTPIP